jgi:hypothetical protein
MGADELCKELQGHTASVCVIAAETQTQAQSEQYSQRLVFSGSYDWTIRVWTASG